MITDINSEDRLVQQTFAEDAESLAGQVYDYVWQRSANGDLFESPAAAQSHIVPADY